MTIPICTAGTFDRLHPGHVLLLETALRLVTPDNRLIVGIMSDMYVAKKPDCELI